MPTPPLLLVVVSSDVRCRVSPAGGGVPRSGVGLLGGGAKLQLLGLLGLLAPPPSAEEWSVNIRLGKFD